MLQYNTKVDKYSAFKLIKRLIKEHINKYRGQLYVAIFFMIIVASCSPAIIKLTEIVIDKVFINHERQMIILLPIMTLSLFSLKGIAEYFQNYLIKLIGQKMLNDLQMRMYEHLLKADLAFIQTQSSGRLISRFTNDIGLMRGAISNLLVGFAKHLLQVILLICLMFSKEPVLSAIVFIAFPLAIYPVQRLGKIMRRTSNQIQDELGNYTNRLDETFQSIKIIKSFIGENIEVSRAKTITRNILHHYKKAIKLDSLTSPLMEILCGTAIAGIIWYGGNAVIQGKTTPGALIAFMMSFSQAYRPFKSLVSLNLNLQDVLAATKRVFIILDMNPSIDDSPNSKKIELIDPEIVFRSVSLNFGEKIALKPINLVVQRGKVTALVGRSGSGKTSIANLINRFYNSTDGQILINDHNIKDIQINSLRGQISLVTQDTILFDSTIAQNIAYGNTSATQEDIIVAAKSADAHKFIMALPQGYDTTIGIAGATLSGGQRQRISIARAFLKAAPILILDEATSSLDSKSENSIIKALQLLCVGKTTLIITHRLSSIIKADHIIVVKDGYLVEQGNHDQLVQNKQEYHKLYSKKT